jgi:competence protein ComEA
MSQNQTKKWGLDKEGGLVMKHFKQLFVLVMAVTLVVAVVPGLLAGEVEKSCDDVAKININKASVDELQQLKYIGPEFAERIVQYRAEHGPFERAEDIMKVKGIGEKALEANQDIITVE